MPPLVEAAPGRVMATRVDLVRPSRDGDHFHYTWAARRCLAMLALDQAPMGISIEGVPIAEGAALDEGLDAIDVGEYFGALDLATASRVRYIQLKHSTRNPSTPWTLSGIKRTVAHFAARYAGLCDRFGETDVAGRFSFEFLSNRPIDTALTTALANLKEGKADAVADRLALATGLEGHRLTGFAALLQLTGRSPDYLGQRSLLERETADYLPDRDTSAAMQLSQLVARRATSQFAERPEITRLDVLEALGVTEGELFPAPNRIEIPARLVPREQVAEIVCQIAAPGGPVVLEAEGGVGKSVTAASLGASLPPNSECLVYDCFGSGGYRGPTGQRHRARDGLVQLANEMASRRLCHPLIPAHGVDAARYFRAFRARIESASAIIADRSPEALLVLVIDAADNAEIAAEESSDGPSFARSLMRETLPANVRLVVTVRPERAHRLDPPPGARRLALHAFSRCETARFLRGAFGDASEDEVSQFHRLTSHNPRVQAAALAGGGTLREVLRRLGPTPLTVEASIEQLLETAVAGLLDGAGSADRAQVAAACMALATLRPFVPLTIVAAIAGVPVSLIRSIASDLRHPLLIRDDAVQFRDEPSETWFRARFAPSSDDLVRFSDKLRHLAKTSSYAAASLPPLLLAAGRFDTLVELTLSDDGLPEDDMLARRDVQLQRLQFAIKAAIRAGRLGDAAALAMKTGREAAAGRRQQRMLSEHADLAGRFLAPDQMLEQVARGEVRGGAWPGSRHAYEAAYLSTVPALRADALIAFNLAMEWLDHWARTPPDDSGRKPVAAADVAALAMAALNIYGPSAAAAELRRWHRREVSFAAGRIVARQLADAARFDDLDALAHTAGNDIGLLLALCVELGAVGRAPPRKVVGRALAIAARPGVQLRACTGFQSQRVLLEAVLALVEAALAQRVGRRSLHARLLARYLPGRPTIPTRFAAGRDQDREVHLRALALHAGLRGRTLTVEGYLAAARRHDPRGQKRPQALRDDNAVAILHVLLPWHNLAARARLSRDRVPAEAFAASLTAWKQQHYPGRSERSATADELARIWASILDDARYQQADWQELADWRSKLDVPLFIPTDVALARRAARRTGLGAIALRLATGAASQIGGPDEDADSQIDSCIRIARALIPLSPAEASAYFDRAVGLASRMGEENVPGWDAMLDIGEGAIVDIPDEPELAYRFARAAEFTHGQCAREKYFDWRRSLEVLSGLSPRLATAQFSRWVDRAFVDERRYLGPFAHGQLDRGSLTPPVAVALAAFAGDWDEADLLRQSLPAIPAALGQKTADLLVGSARLERPNTARWSDIASVIDAHGLDSRDARTGLATARRVAGATSSLEHGPDRRGRARTRQRSYRRLLNGLDVTDASALAAAEAMLNARRGPRDRRAFYSAAMTSVHPGSEAAFLDALAEGAPPSLLGIRDLVDAIPRSWKQRAAVPAALSRLVRAQARAESRRLHLGRHYEQLPWEELQSLCGVDRRALAAEAVAAIGDQADPLAGDEAFQLVGLLAALLAPDEARLALHRSLELFEPLYEPTSSDGPFTASLVPPRDPAEVWAGYLWAALGSPVAARRWQAAHAVRRLAALGERAVLAGIVAFAQAIRPGPFADASLRFYEQHARLWLAIALERAATETPDAVQPHAPWLNQWATRAETHLLLRSFAARALLALVHSGHLPVAPAREKELAAMRDGALAPKMPRAVRPRRIGAALEPLMVDYDFQRREVPGMANALGVAEPLALAAMQSVVRNDWRLADIGRWADDARAQRGFYQEHTAYGGPRSRGCDNLNEYLSFHALYTAAGKLLAASARTADPGPERLTDWLRGEGLTRPGQWQADRRDPLPPDLAGLAGPAGDEWPGRLCETDAERHLFPAPGRVAVDARYVRFSGERRERVTIASALVDRTHARALARALRAHPDPWEPELPEYGDPPIGARGFLLEGWIARHGAERGLDRHDPWAAELTASRVEPGPPYLIGLGLDPAPGGRTFSDNRGVAAMRADVWSEGIDGDTVRYGGGSRLTMRAGLMARLAARCGRAVLVSVRIERDMVELRHSIPRDKDDFDAQTFTQAYLYESGTGWWRPGSCSAPRRRAGRRARRR